MLELIPILIMMESVPEIPSDDPDGIIATNIKGNIEFKEVNFKYPTRPNVKVLNDYTLKIKAGEVVAFCGESGCGKSTCIKLVLRNYDVLENKGGQVLIDGVDIRKYNLKSLHKFIGVVSQEPALMKGTLLTNITYGCEEGKWTMKDVE